MSRTVEELLASSVPEGKAELVRGELRDTLDGGTVVPGFTCPVSDIFEGIARDASG